RARLPGGGRRRGSRRGRTARARSLRAEGPPRRRSGDAPGDGGVYSHHMSRISRGFHGRRRDDAQQDRVPPGQYVTTDFPVRSAGPTPHTPLEQWTFAIEGEIDEPRRWTWDELRALPSEQITKDIHCVTKWSKLDTEWEGVSVDTLLDGVTTEAEHVVAFCD